MDKKEKMDEKENGWVDGWKIHPFFRIFDET